jgi:hypothetical protein
MSLEQTETRKRLHAKQGQAEEARRGTGQHQAHDIAVGHDQDILA